MGSPQELFKNVSAGKFKPAYYFFGIEDYRIVEAEKFVAHQFLPDLQSAINYIRIDGRRTSNNNLIMELSNLPMLGERQVFAIRDFQNYKPTEVERVLKLISPEDTTRIVIFSSPSDRSPRKSSAFIKNISKVTEMVEFHRLSAAETAGLIRRRLTKHKISIDDDACRLLVELTGGSRGGLEGELNKLVDYRQEGQTVTVADIKELTSSHEVYNIFELGDLIVARSTGRAIQSLNFLLSAGSSAVAILTLLQQHFISLYLVKNGKAPLGRRAFLIGRFRQQAGRYSNDRLEEIIIQIATSDANLRKSDLTPTASLQILITQLTGQNSGKARIS